jgi:uncharacterized protein (TIGR02646 family)
MIRINKSPNAPAILTAAGATETANLCAAYSANPAGFTSAPGISARLVMKMKFDNKIYGASAVKNQLAMDQHYKCCFCEGKFSDFSYGDVEHFRPKKAHKKYLQKGLTYPGYYWLAYDWSNLMYSCEKCNRKFKGNDFPLFNEGTRCAYHTHVNPTANEDCLLINPTTENPSLYITFDKGIPIPVNHSLKGKVSIKKYGLDRLNGSRIENLNAIRVALTLANIDETNRAMVDNARAISNSPLSHDQFVQSIIDSKNLYNSAAKAPAKFAHSVRCEFPALPTV